MKRILPFLLGAVLFIGIPVGAQTIPSVSPWFVDTMNRITQRVAGTPVYINGNLTVTGTCTGCGGGSGTPGAASSSVQYNANGAFGGSSNIYTNGTNLGIGISAPQYPVHIVIATSSNSGTNIGVRQTTSFTPTSAAYTTELEGAYDYLEVNAATAVDSAASAVVRARYIQAINFSNKAVNSLYAVTGEGALGGGATGSVNSLYGIHGDVINNGAAGGTITNGFPVFSECRSTGASTLSTCVGFYGDASYTSGNFTHYIGLDVPTHASVASTSISALLGDNVGIGTGTTSPYGLLTLAANGLSKPTLVIGTTTKPDVVVNESVSGANTALVRINPNATYGSSNQNQGDGALLVSCDSSNGLCEQVTRNNASAAAPLRLDFITNASDPFAVDSVITAGTGAALTLSQTNANNTQASESISNAGKGGGLTINMTNTASVANGLRINATSSNAAATTVLLRQPSYVTVALEDLSLCGAAGNFGVCTTGGGTFQLTDRNDVFRFEGRQQDDTQFNVAGLYTRPNAGGQFWWGGAGDIFSAPTGGAMFNVVAGTSTLPLLNLTSTTTSSSLNGDIFTVLRNGFTGIGSTTPGSLLAIGSSTNFINLSNTATSTFSHGINITNGCFAINGTCVGSGGSGTVTSVATNNGITGGTITTTGTIGLAAIAANSVLGNITGSSAVPTALATSSLFLNASVSNTGLLTSTDWSTFNGKQNAGNYITALTGDVTASGPGSVAATLATVNSNVGSFTNANVTVNAKGLVTAVSNGSGGSPAGASSTIQYNANGSFGGASDVYTDGTNLGIGTNVPPTSLSFGSTGTGISLYNTSDQTTNFELGKLYWNSNVLTLSATKGGTGILRSLTIDGGNVLTLASGGTSRFTVGTLFQANTAAGPALSNTTGLSSTVPVFLPDKAQTNTGFAAGTAGNINVIVGGAESARWTSVGYGQGSSTPWANLSVSGTGSATVPLFAVASTTNQGLPNFEIDPTGHVVTSGPKPVLSSCGSTNSISGNDNNGTIMFTGTLVTACTMTFATAVPTGQTVECQASTNTTAAFADVSATSTTAITFGTSATLSSGAIFYSCERHQ